MKRSATRRKAARVPAALVVLLGAATAAAGCREREASGPPPVAVTLETVGGSAGSAPLRYSANVEPATRVAVAFKAGGYVESILEVPGVDGRRRLVQEGDIVRKGDVLARIRSSDYEERVAEARADLTRARGDFHRAQALFENKSVSRADYDAASAYYRAAQARHNQALQALADCALTAPLAGTVLSRSVEIGTLASPGAPAFEVGDLSSVAVVFGVPDVIVGTLSMGSEQSITTHAVPGTVFRGAITRISPAAEAASRVFEVECTIQNPDRRLRPGMIASLELATDEARSPMPDVPLNAIVRPPGRTEGYAVFVVADSSGKLVARERAVTPGDISGNRVGIASGLVGGERVVVRGATLLVDGQVVEVLP